MGLVARRIEAAGIATVCLSPIPDLTGAVGVSRLVGIEHPFGRTLGQPGDAETHLEVVRTTLDAAWGMTGPGSVTHLPFEWPETLAQARAHSQELPPIATYLKRRPWLLPKLIARDIPT